MNFEQKKKSSKVKADAYTMYSDTRFDCLYWLLIPVFELLFLTLNLKLYLYVSVSRMRGSNGTLTTTVATATPAKVAVIPSVQEETILLCKCFNALFSHS